MQVHAKSGKNAEERTNNAGKEIAVGHLYIIAPLVMFGGLFAVLFLYLIWVGDLGFIVPIKWLRRFKVPKCLYRDVR